MQVIEEVSAELPPLTLPLPARPWWIAYVACNRHLWHCTALCSSDPDDMRVFLFLYAKMSPYEAIYAELREELLHWPELPAELADPLQLHHESQRVFALVQPFRAVSSAELGSHGRCFHHGVGRPSLQERSDCGLP